MEVEFAKRNIPVDFALIDAIDPSLIEKGLCLDLLQKSLHMIAFGNVADIVPMDGKRSAVVERLVKMYRIAQFTIEYLLISQQQLEKALEGTKAQLGQSTKQYDILKDTMYKDKKLWKNETVKLVQQQAGVGKYSKCNICSKLFLTAAFLDKHIAHSHPNVAPTTAPIAAAAQIALASQEAAVSDASNQDVLKAINHLRHDVRRLNRTVVRDQQKQIHESDTTMAKIAALEEGVANIHLALRQGERNAPISTQPKPNVNTNSEEERSISGSDDNPPRQHHDYNPNLKGGRADFVDVSPMNDSKFHQPYVADNLPQRAAGFTEEEDTSGSLLVTQSTEQPPHVPRGQGARESNTPTGHVDSEVNKATVVKSNGGSQQPENEGYSITGAVTDLGFVTEATSGWDNNDPLDM